jgi:hypothetical protein
MVSDYLSAMGGCGNPLYSSLANVPLHLFFLSFTHFYRIAKPVVVNCDCLFI